MNKIYIRAYDVCTVTCATHNSCQTPRHFDLEVESIVTPAGRRLMVEGRVERSSAKTAPQAGSL